MRMHSSASVGKLCDGTPCRQPTSALSNRGRMLLRRLHVAVLHSLQRGRGELHVAADAGSSRAWSTTHGKLQLVVHHQQIAVPAYLLLHIVAVH